MKDGFGPVVGMSANEQTEADVSFALLPSLLRHAVRALDGPVATSISSEIAAAFPTLEREAHAWLAAPDAERAWRALTDALDENGTDGGLPALLDAANAVRIDSMTVAEAVEMPREAIRVASALLAAKQVAARAGAPADMLGEVERLGIGWLALAAGMPVHPASLPRQAHRWAYETGYDLTEAIDSAAELRAAGVPIDETRTGISTEHEVSRGHVVVCPALPFGTSSTRDGVASHAHVVGKPLPLVATPDLASVRRTLACEYPYAVQAIDGLLSPLVGTEFVRVPPTVLVGPPGSGKSRLARRLSELLGTGLWRTDAARSDNSSFGGTDRRWATTEACHPFLAVSRTRLANPLVLVDELDKAGVGRHNGRLWDALHNFLERETSRTYPDPQLQVEIDLSNVGYVLTCNDIGALPQSLIDRCRVIEVPSPSIRELDALLPSLLCGIAADQGLDGRWVEPLTGEERALVARHWRGGSVRHLSRLLAAVLRARARNAPTH